MSQSCIVSVPLSFALLVALLRRALEVVRRHDLLGEVWPNARVCDEALSQRVRLLRESLDDGAGSARDVESVRGWGHRIAQPVERVGGPKPTVSSPAVLPFVNMTGAPTDDYLCEGLVEETISALLPRGRLDEAAAVVDGVVHTDPLSLFVRRWMGVMAFLGRRFDRAIEEGRHMVSLDPNHFLGHWVLGVTLEETGAVTDAIVALEKAHQLSGGIPFTLGFLAMASGRSGRHGDARALLQLLEEAAAVGYVSPMCFAFCFAGLGEWDRALAAMEQAIEAHDPLVMPIKSYPFLDPVRSDPRLDALKRRMNLD